MWGQSTETCSVFFDGERKNFPSSPGASHLPPDQGERSFLVFFTPHGSSRGFFLRLVALVGEHAELGTPRALSFLPADLGDLFLFGGPCASKLRFDFVQQNSSSQKTIEGLGPLLLAFYPNARGPMVEQHTGGNLVDLLTARARRPDKLFLDIVLANSQSLRSLQETLLLFR
jgi:hypothetical protein